MDNLGIEGKEEYDERANKINKQIDLVIPWASKDFRDKFVKAVIDIADKK